jgi:hypothetical protein
MFGGVGFVITSHATNAATLTITDSTITTSSSDSGSRPSVSFFWLRPPRRLRRHGRITWTVGLVPVARSYQRLSAARPLPIATLPAISPRISRP